MLCGAVHWHYYLLPCPSASNEFEYIALELSRFSRATHQSNRPVGYIGGDLSKRKLSTRAAKMVFRIGAFEIHSVEWKFITDDSGRGRRFNPSRALGRE